MATTRSNAKPELPSRIACAAKYSAWGIHSSAPVRSMSHEASPAWSGWWCVTRSRVTGLPAMRVAKMFSHSPRVTSSPIPQSTSVQAGLPPASSSSSQRLMWSSANGSGMRAQCTPGAISSVSPPAGGAPTGYSRTDSGLTRLAAPPALAGGRIAFRFRARILSNYGGRRHRIDQRQELDRRSRPGARRHPARHPLLRGRGPAFARARRQPPRLFQARLRAPEADPARQAPGLLARRGAGDARALRLGARRAAAAREIRRRARRAARAARAATRRDRRGAPGDPRLRAPVQEAPQRARREAPLKPVELAPN